MYLNIDLFTPKYNAYISNTRSKNVVMKHWPKIGVGENQVFDKLVFYDGDVLNTPAHQAIYKLLGTSAAQLDEQEYDGVDEAWFYLKPYTTGIPSITDQQVADFINAQSVLDEEHTVRMVYTQKVSRSGVRNAPVVSSEDIVNMIEGGWSSRYTNEVINNVVSGKIKDIMVYNSELITYDITVNPCTFISITDVLNTVFESETRVLTKSITPTYFSESDITEYTIEAAVEYKFKRVVDATAAMPLTGEIDNMISTFPSNNFSFYKQVNYMLENIEPTGYYDYTTTSGWPLNILKEDDKKSISVAAAEDMKAKDFKKMLIKCFDTDYEEEEADSWAGILGAILTIVIIIIAVYTGIGAAAGLSGLEAAAAFAGTFGLMLGAGMLVMSMVQMVIANNSGQANAMAFGDSMVILETLSMIAGIVSLFTGIAAAARAISNAATKAAQEAAVEAGKAVVKDGIVVSTVTGAVVEPTLTNYVSAAIEYAVPDLGGMFTFENMSTSEVLGTVTKWLNRGFSVYTEVIAPVEHPEIPEQTKEVEDMPLGVGELQMRQVYFDTYGFIDLNEQMHNMVGNMTAEGLERRSMCKYYNGL